MREAVEEDAGGSGARCKDWAMLMRACSLKVRERAIESKVEGLSRGRARNEGREEVAEEDDDGMARCCQCNCSLCSRLTLGVE